METFKTYLMEHWFSRKPTPAPEPKAAEPARPFSKTAMSGASGGFKSSNRDDPARSLNKDTLHSEYNKHRLMRQETHTDATKKRHKELEDEVVRRGGKARLSPEWHDQHQAVKPVGRINWKDESGNNKRGY